MNDLHAHSVFMASPGGKPPLALPGFEHINRYWDKTRSKYVAKIHPGEYYVTNSGELISTVLGSCIAACIRYPAQGIGGMNHFMLPATKKTEFSLASDISDATRYGNFAMEALINAILRLGAQRPLLEVKIFGGGKVLAQMTNIGMQNVRFVHSYLQAEGLKVLAEDTGGIHPRKVVYDPVSGKVGVKKLKATHNNTIEVRETQYQQKISTTTVQGEVDLFSRS